MAKTIGVYINADDIKKASLCSNLEAAIKEKNLEKKCWKIMKTSPLKQYFPQNEI